MSVTLRQKPLKNGKLSLYLDINVKGKRWTEFLDIHINKRMTEEDKLKKDLANKKRTEREHDLNVKNLGITHHQAVKIDLLSWFIDFAKRKPKNSKTKSTLFNLRTYLKDRVIFLKDLTTEDMEGFLSWLMERQMFQTYIGYFTEVSQCLDKAVKEHLIPTNPCRLVNRKELGVKRSTTKREAFSLQQLELLATTQLDIHPQIKQGFFFSCFTGLRWSDVHQLKWDEILTKEINGEIRWYLYFEQEKTEEVEYIPLSVQAIEIIQSRMKEREQTGDTSAYVFPKLVEDNPRNPRYKYCWVVYHLKRWAKAAGLHKKELHFHKGRHTFAFNVLEHCEGADIFTLKTLLGHRDIAATMVYAKIGDKRKDMVVKSMPRLKSAI